MLRRNKVNQIFQLDNNFAVVIGDAMNRKVWMDKGKLPLCGLPVAPLKVKLSASLFCPFNLALFHGHRQTHVINLDFRFSEDVKHANAKVAATTPLCICYSVHSIFQNIAMQVQGCLLVQVKQTHCQVSMIFNDRDTDWDCGFLHLSSSLKTAIAHNLMCHKYSQHFA